MRRHMNLLDYLDVLIVRIDILFGLYQAKGYELKVIRALAERISPQAAAVLEAQMNVLNYWYRQSKGQYVLMIPQKQLEMQPLPPSLRFPLALSEQELPLATVRCRSQNGINPETLRCDVYIRDGQLCQLTFDAPAKHILGKAYHNSSLIEIEDVEVIFDPMDKNAIGSERFFGPSDLRGWLREWSKRWPVKEITKALPIAVREKLIRFYDVQLPSEYLELTEQVESLTVGDCSVLGLSMLRSFVTPKENYYIAAYLGTQGVLCFLRNAPPGIYYIDSEDLMPIHVGHSFRRAVEAALEDGVGQWKDQV